MKYLVPVVTLIVLGVVNVHRGNVASSILVEAASSPPDQSTAATAGTQVTPTVQGATGTVATWFSYYSSKYNISYTCWLEGSTYATGFQSYSYVSGSYLPVYNRDPTSIGSWTSSCGTVDKWRMTSYACPYVYPSMGSLCTQQGIFQGNEFWKSVPSNATNYSYCKYSPISLHDCNTFMADVGSSTGSLWSVTSATVTTCYHLTIYYQGDCSWSAPSSSWTGYQGSYSWAPYSLQSTSKCSPQYVYTTATVSNNLWTSFYVPSTSCSTYYQWYSSFVSCGYDASYYYDSSNIWRLNMTSQCRTMYDGTSYSSGDYVSYDFSCGSSSNSTYLNNCQWSPIKGTRSYSCSPYLSSYSWCYYSSSSYPYCSAYFFSSQMCDAYDVSLIRGASSSYTSCNTHVGSSTFSCYTYDSYSYQTYGLMSYLQYIPLAASYCFSYVNPVQSCYDCQLLTTSSSMSSWITSIYSSCRALPLTSSLYHSYACNSYYATYLNCTEMGYRNVSMTPAPYNAYGSTYSWQRSWWCKEGSRASTYCSSCQYYVSYFYYPPSCSPASYTYSDNQTTCSSSYSYIYSLCSTTANESTTISTTPEATTTRSSPVTPTPTPRTVPPPTSTITTAPSICKANYCMNNGSCLTNGCISGYSACCSCTADYVGERCETNRSFVIASTLKSAAPYLADLMDPTSELYHNYSFTFISLWYNVTLTAYREIYDGQDFVDIKIVVTKFTPGSVIVNFLTTGALSTKATNVPAVVMQPNATTLQKALQSVCSSGSTCASMSINTSAVTVNYNVNVCDDALSNSCSANAKCNSPGGVDYTCTCIAGYRDDAPTYTRKGSICTEICTNQICKNGASCSEVSNSAAQCQCSWTYSGRFCNDYSAAGKIFIALMCLGLIFLIIITILILKILRAPQIRVSPEFKVPIVIEDE